MSFDEGLKPLEISLPELLSATNNFAKENQIGSGGFGKVYMGKSDKYGIVAVKRLNCDRGEHSHGDREFKTEIALLSIYNHENIVTLIGFCDETGEKILVYQYESNQSLDKHLGSVDLTWTQRLQICLGAALGLKYLHHDVPPENRIIHRDVKSANILLNKNLNAKICDFGLCREGLGESSFVISNACGTPGYIDPEYFYTGYLTQKSDVFSFGIVLFEVLCGRPAFVKVDGQFFYVWVQKHYKRQTLDKVIHTGLHGEINVASLVTFSNIAYRCLSSGEDRPTMKEVVEQLHNALDDQLGHDLAALHQTPSRHEYIKGIVGTISGRLLVCKDLIGIETRLNDLKTVLKVRSGGVRMVGICGVGGCGKTTIAYSVYKELSYQFEDHYFIENVREEYMKHGLIWLQKKFLSYIRRTTLPVVGSVEVGRGMIKSKLCYKKVLVVLDNVDNIDQIDALAGSHDWFGVGSRVIIITRDEQLLSRKVNAIYVVPLLSHSEATELFHRYAYQEYKPIEECDKLSKDVISNTNGLPLALKIMGSFLYNKDKDEWIRALTKLRDVTDKGTMDMLKICYDGLQSDIKELFLDITCLLYDEPVDCAIPVLEAFGFHPAIGLKELQQKSLLSISNGQFYIHDVVKEMAHYIARGEHPRHPEEHTRVWLLEDVTNVCAIGATKENHKLEALSFPNGFKNPSLSQVISNMKNLRYISWVNYNESSFPTIQATKLLCLKLTAGLQKQLWEGYKVLPHLKILDVSQSRNLVRTPDFNGLPCLERLLLKHCEELREIHPSIGYHETLILLDMEGCIRLERFPPINRMRKLETLVLSHCSRLGKFPNIQMSMDSLLELRLNGTAIEIIPSSVGQCCTNMVSLDLNYCKKLKTIEGNFHLLRQLKDLHVFGCEELAKLPKDLFDVECRLERFFLSYKARKDSILSKNLMKHVGLKFSHQDSMSKRLPQFPRFLKELNLSNCNLGDGNIPSDMYELQSLEVLYLNSNKFSRLQDLSGLRRLKVLNLSFCCKLVEVRQLPSSLAILRAYNCSALAQVGDLSICKGLWDVSLARCGRLSCGSVVHSLLKENVAREHRMSVTLPYRAREFEFEYDEWAYRLQLKQNWDNDFTGFLFCIDDTDGSCMLTVTIKQEEETQMNSQPDEWNKFSRKLKSYEYSIVGYVPFASLRRTSWWNSAYTKLSFYVNEKVKLKVGLVPKTIGDSRERATGPINCLELWDEEYPEARNLRIEKDTKWSIQILWNHCT